MKINNPFRSLSRFEFCLWAISAAVITASFVFSGGGDILTVVAALIGVTALIFVAKGYVIGQVLTVLFAVFYGVISFYFRYYGEMITYLAMTAPSAVAVTISWLRHPYRGTAEVRVAKLTLRLLPILVLLTAAVTVAFYFILKWFGNANLVLSTISVATSFLASCLTFLRSRYYAIAYAANDLVLIVLWFCATAESLSYLPMFFCFVMFLVNDLYGFYSWRKMEARQSKNG